MRRSILVTVALGAALSLAGCSQKTQQAAGVAADSAAMDTATNADKAATAVAGAANNVGVAASGAAMDTAAALHKGGAKVSQEASEAAH